MQNNQDETKPQKAVLFARVSTLRQEKEGLSLDEIQLPRMRKYAEEHNLEIVAIYAIGESASGYKKRKQFDEMVSFLRENRDVNNVIAFRVDRITRNYRDSVIMDDMRLNSGLYLHFVDEQLVLHKNSPARDLTVWNVKVFIAQEQLNRYKDDGKKTKQTKLNNGELPWKAPYGYKNQKHTTSKERVVPIEPEASIVKEIFEEFATGAYSCRSLAKEMHMRYGGMGQKFSQKKIQHILREPFYTGQIYDEDGDAIYPHIYVTLVATEAFEACGEILSEHKVSHHRCAGNNESIYQGFITCGKCGCDVIPDFKNKAQKNGNTHHYNYYHCTNAKGTHEAQRNITEEIISNSVKNVLSNFFLSEEQIQSLSNDVVMEHAHKLEFYKSERIKLAKQRGIIKRRQQNTYDDMADRIISRETYDDNNKRYQEELLKIDEEERRLDGVDETLYTTSQYLQELVRHIADIFEAGRIDEKRRILSIIFETIQLDGKKLNLVARPHFSTYLTGVIS